MITDFLSEEEKRCKLYAEKYFTASDFLKPDRILYDTASYVGINIFYEEQYMLRIELRVDTDNISHYLVYLEDVTNMIKPVMVFMILGKGLEKLNKELKINLLGFIIDYENTNKENWKYKDITLID